MSPHSGTSSESGRGDRGIRFHSIHTLDTGAPGKLPHLLSSLRVDHCLGVKVEHSFLILQEEVIMNMGPVKEKSPEP